jgi:flagellar biosynthesis GTPase FlhF
MGTKIHFYSGKIIELDEAEGKSFWDRMSKAGIRAWQSRSQNITIPFNSSTIEFIENDEAVVKTVGELEADKREQEEKKRKERVAEKKMSQEDRTKEKEELIKEMEEDFMARANCTHKKGDKTLYQLQYSETAQGRKFFPVCSFCGHRGRYVGLQKIEEGKSEWTVDDVEYATVYEG